VEGETMTEAIWFVKYQHHMYVLFDWHGTKLASCFTRTDAVRAAEQIAAKRSLRVRIAE
jgi:hypothetical protein